MNAEQQYRAKTRAAVRFGYPIYWVLLDGASDARRAARDALTPEWTAAADVTFGTFNPKTDTLDLGDAITFDQYCVPVESLDAFRIGEVVGYRAGAAHVPETEFGCDFGWVRIAGDAYRVYATRDGREVRLVPPGRPVDYVSPCPLTDESSWLAQRIAGGDVERVGPIPPTSTDERRSPTNLPPRRD